MARKSSKKPIRPQSLVCSVCSEKKKLADFYTSSSVFHAGTGRVPYCKDCIRKMSTDENGNVVSEKLQVVLKEIDKPYIHHLLQAAFDETVTSKLNTTNVIGIYFKNINSLPQYKTLTWADSEAMEEEIESLATIDDMVKNFRVTDEIINKWGAGYTNEEYYYFEKKWEMLIDNYGQKTSFHVESLITYIRFRVKEELATAKGEIGPAKTWAGLAKDAATAAKINVQQLSKADISGGVELLPQLFEAIESKIGIIPILPKVKEQPYDDVDLIIWCVINYARRLEGKPPVAYRDVWDFYDRMFEEYCVQRGLTKKQIKEEKKKRYDVFRDMEDVYVEPVYEEDDF